MESNQEGSVSIKRELGGATILLTGATGYVGSVVLEQLLRCSSVRRVYCLLRAKKGSPAKARLHSIFKTNPLFHLVRDTPAANRAAAVEGDISLPGLGIDPETRAMLEAESQYIIHCAADIALEADIQVSSKAGLKSQAMLSGVLLGRAARPICPHLVLMIYPLVWNVRIRAVRSAKWLLCCASAC